MVYYTLFCFVGSSTIKLSEQTLHYELVAYSSFLVEERYLGETWGMKPRTY